MLKLLPPPFPPNLPCPPRYLSQALLNPPPVLRLLLSLSLVPHHSPHRLRCRALQAHRHCRSSHATCPRLLSRPHPAMVSMPVHQHSRPPLHPTRMRATPISLLLMPVMLVLALELFPAEDRQEPGIRSRVRKGCKRREVLWGSQTMPVRISMFLRWIL